MTDEPCSGYHSIDGKLGEQGLAIEQEAKKPVKRNLWRWITIIGFLVVGLGAGCGPRITLLTTTPEAAPDSAPAPGTPIPAGVGAADAPVGVPSSTPVASVDYQSVGVASNAEARVGPRSKAVNIRRGPGTTYEIIGAINVGKTARALFRDATSQWINIMTDDGLVGWVATDLVIFVSGSIDQLMVATVEPVSPGVVATVELPPDEDAPEDETPDKAPTPPTETPGLAITKVPPAPQP